MSGGQASSLQRDNVAMLRGRSTGCEKRLVSGNWRRKTERTTLDRNYVLCILLEQEQRCSSTARASPSSFLFEHILFVRAVLWLTAFAGLTSTACQQTGPSTQPLVPPAIFCSVVMTKLTVNLPCSRARRSRRPHDVDQFTLASMSEDHKEGVAAFLERRKPRFRGR